MSTYLFSWNPVKWPWPAFEESVQKIKSKQPVAKDWRCISHKSVRPGDRAFLVKVGAPPRGVIGSGIIIKAPFLSNHKTMPNREIYLVKTQFDTLLDPGKEPILTNDILNVGKLASQNWAPQASGISIKPELVDELEALWSDFLNGG